MLGRIAEEGDVKLAKKIAGNEPSDAVGKAEHLDRKDDKGEVEQCVPRKRQLSTNSKRECNADGCLKEPIVENKAAEIARRPLSHILIHGCVDACAEVETEGCQEERQQRETDEAANKTKHGCIVEEKWPKCQGLS